VLARNPSFVLGGIRLCGLPASRTGTHRRLFALPPRKPAVSLFSLNRPWWFNDFLFDALY